MTEKFEERCIVSGIGQSDVGRRLPQSELALTAQACLEAIGDAGLSRDDIDGLVTFPGRIGVPPPGFTGPGTDVVQDMLGLQLNFRLSSFDGPGQLQAVVNACMAVASGLARHVLVYRTVTEASGQGTGGRSVGVPVGGTPPRADRASRFVPFGAYSAVHWLALVAQRHFHTFGTTREQLGAIALTERANATLNPKAVLREPMTMEQYLGARLISTPFGLFDCDIPVDGSTALVVSHADYAKDSPHPRISFEAIGTAARGRAGVAWDLYEDLTETPGFAAAAHMWSRSTLQPDDVDVACLYDGFTILALLWMEALGLVPRGGGPFIEGGARISREEGDFALNPHGGQLSAGRLHGFGYIHEAVAQLRGSAGARQVPRQPTVAVVSNGGGHMAGCFLLTRDAQ